MKNEKECNIIRDLLPNYIEKLTNNDTNEFIEKHIENCEECNDLLKNYKTENKVNEDDKIFINYAKKFNLKFNILKYIIIIIVFILIVITINKAIIINNLISKSNSYEKSTNYYSKYYQYTENEITIIDSYNYNNIYFRTLKNINRKTGENTLIIKEFYDGQVAKINTIYNGENHVSISTEKNSIMPITPTSYYLKLMSPYDYLKNYLFASIKETTCNGIKCYRFTNLYNYQVGNNDYIYISKDNGLPIRCSVQSSDLYNEMREFSFEFDKLTEKDILELVDF